MPGFSIRSVRWGPPPNLAPTAPARFISNTVRHRYVKAFAVFLGIGRALVSTPETQAYIPRTLTHLKSHFNDVFPLSPAPEPSIRQLARITAFPKHRINKRIAYFYGHSYTPDPGPPATTRPLGFIRPVLKQHKYRFSVSYLFGALGGDAVGPIPDRPKFGIIQNKLQTVHRRFRAYTYQIKLVKPIIIPPTDKIYKVLIGEPKPHRRARKFSLLNYKPKFVPTVTNYLSLIEFFNFRVRLDVKKAVDSGIIAANSADAGGTTVTFNRAFKDVESIVATVQETTQFIVVVDFVDIPNPTTFKVLVFNTAGVRQSKTVYWVARGII